MSSPTHRLPGGKGYLRPSTGEILPGVTTLIKALDGDPGALIGWATKLTAQAAVDTAADWKHLSTAEEATALIKARSRRQQSQKRDLGTLVHQMIEDWMKGSQEPGFSMEVEPALQPYMEGLGCFLEEYGFSALATEVTVVNTEVGYAGTLDAMGQIGSDVVMVDWKTGSLRPTMAAQMLLLNAANIVLGDDGTEVPFMGADRLLIVQISPGDYSVTEVDKTPDAEHLATVLVEARRYAQTIGSKMTRLETPARLT